MTGLRPATAPGEAIPNPVAYEMNGQVVMTSESSSGARVGATASGSTWGVWGFAERIHKQADHMNETADGRYGEFSTVHSIGPWSFTAGGGGGDDPALRPSFMILGDMTRRFPGLRTAIYAGHTRTGYNGTNKSLYRFYRLGSLVDVLPNLNLNINFQLIDRTIDGDLAARRGSSGGISVTRSAGEHQIGASASLSCLGNQLWCKGGPLERYAEFFINGRIAMAPTYGLIGKVGYTTQSSGITPAEDTPGNEATPAATQIWFGGYQKL